MNIENYEKEVRKFEEINKDNFGALDDSCKKMKNIVKIIEEFEIPRIYQTQENQIIGFTDLPPELIKK